MGDIFPSSAEDTPKMPGSTYNPAESMMGAPLFGKPSQQDKQQTQQALMSAISLPRELWENTAGIRGNITDMLENFTSGNFDLATSPMFAGGKADIESAYRTSKEDLLANVPAGGSLNAELANLAEGRALGMTDLISGIQNDLLKMAYGAGYGTPGQVFGGMNQATGNLSNYMAMQQAMAGQNAQGIGSLIGALIA